MKPGKKMTRKKKNKGQHKNKHNKDWKSKLARIEKKRKKRQEVPNDRDQIVFNPLREGRAPNHFKEVPPLYREEFKELQEKHKVIEKNKI